MLKRILLKQHGVYSHCTGGDERTATTKSTTTVMPTSAIRSGETTLEDRTTSNGSYITFPNKRKEKRGRD